LPTVYFCGDKMKAWKFFTNKPWEWLIVTKNDSKTVCDAIKAWEKAPNNLNEELLGIEETK
jgi:hypothetical protein